MPPDNPIEQIAPIAVGAAGRSTAGPPRSAQTSTSSLSWWSRTMSRVPLSTDRQPYFIEFVANSCITRAMAVAAVSPTPFGEPRRECGH